MQEVHSHWKIYYCEICIGYHLIGYLPPLDELINFLNNQQGPWKYQSKNYEGILLKCFDDDKILQSKNGLTKRNGSKTSKAKTSFILYQVLKKYLWIDHEL